LVGFDEAKVNERRDVREDSICVHGDPKIATLGSDYWKFGVLEEFE
jgi:hypothetical protein